MSLDQNTLAQAAERLEEAERTRVACRQFSLDYPDMTIDDAYAIQHAWMQLKLRNGRTVKGHKIGLTSKAMQRAVNIAEPDYGTLLDDMFYRDGAVIPSERFLQLKIEAELAFVLARPLSGPDCTLFDVLDATAYVTPALEILDARIQRIDPETKRTRNVFDTISDNAANAALVLGGRPFKPAVIDADMRRIGAIVSRNGEVEETGLAAGVLNHPGYGVAWLANRLHRFGVTLQPGQVILAGSFIRPIEVGKGDTIVADYGEFGTVSCHFG
ncbi:2-oxo-hept-4-ene-1,7-dioate hydratase [Variovorax arabinosiphilus]|jgi:2-oxo-hept-3-ene-1,7-dioate hydratase|uniref:2-oxo-hept-4-ene-1,7-dioate hydratase n=1 Tax=Variovorax arabinosiphilus TaxID=3053498 RepID=UPI0025752DA4|nr:MULTISPECIES: 2-oxo-hepta-3-ene-1,7-dioic acid hydratase [unclassified Variovorax]MDM0120944.1 2-oxo-hepta-3-ene-1,7-dioic acid hydratase [Variovorax sp. J2L1-78]MDM0130005.1 2-oxo-hepta-3-ene-1,7-dioic acid hydratase [Variovorax sp. J2L1-63]MDM0233707.1 2-oxo-hepta-3-ene-1,7-dioic acid hydratase [Variovorax sp. J2R1-6]